MGISKDEQLFHQILNALARACNMVLDPVLLEVYDGHLSSKYDYQKINTALRDILINRNSLDPFPSVKEIEKQINPEVSQKSQATMIANRIRKCIKTRGGYAKLAEMSDEIGQVGVQVVQLQGGWTAICERANETDRGIFFAQLERSILAVLENEYVERKQEQLEGRDLKQLNVNMKELV